MCRLSGLTERRDTECGLDQWGQRRKRSIHTARCETEDDEATQEEP